MEKVEDYLLKIDFNTAGVPPEAFTAFPESFVDPIMRQEVIKMWKVGQDYLYGNVALAKHPQAEAIFRAKRIEINLEEKKVTLHTPSGLEIETSITEFHEKDVEQIISELSDLIFCRINNNNGKLEMESFTALKATANIEVANSLLQNYTPLELLTRAIGYIYHPQILAPLIPRFLSWIGGVNGFPLHVLQLEPPNTGKTVFALRSEIAFNYEYLNEPPTLAHLVYDGKEKSLGPVFTKDGLIFDEFDKYSLQKERVQMCLDILLTGMENGRWVRGVSSAGFPIPNIRRLIPILFMGNITNAGYFISDDPKDMRKNVESMLTEQWGFSTSALIDRIAVIEAYREPIYISSCLSNQYLPDSILRGVTSILKQRLIPSPIDTSLSGRLQRHCDNVNAALHSLDIFLTETKVEDLVLGTYPFTLKEIPNLLPKENFITKNL